MCDIRHNFNHVNLNLSTTFFKLASWWHCAFNKCVFLRWLPVLVQCWERLLFVEVVVIIVHLIIYVSVLICKVKSVSILKVYSAIYSCVGLIPVIFLRVKRLEYQNIYIYTTKHVKTHFIFQLLKMWTTPFYNCNPSTSRYEPMLCYVQSVSFIFNCDADGRQ